MIRLRGMLAAVFVVGIAGCGENPAPAPADPAASASGVAGADNPAPAAPVVKAVVLDAIALAACNGAVADSTGALAVEDTNAKDYASMWCPLSLPTDRAAFTSAVVDAEISANSLGMAAVRVDYVDASSASVAQYDAVFMPSGENGPRGEGASIEAFEVSKQADGSSLYKVSLETPVPPPAATQATITFFPAAGAEFQKYEVESTGAGTAKKIQLTLK